MFLERERERELRWGGFIKGLGSTGGLGRVCSGQKVVIQPSSRKLGVQEGLQCVPAPQAVVVGLPMAWLTARRGALSAARIAGHKGKMAGMGRPLSAPWMEEPGMASGVPTGQAPTSVAHRPKAFALSRQPVPTWRGSPSPSSRQPAAITLPRQAIPHAAVRWLPHGRAGPTVRLWQRGRHPEAGPPYPPAPRWLSSTRPSAASAWPHWL